MDKKQVLLGGAIVGGGGFVFWGIIAGRLMFSIILGGAIYASLYALAHRDGKFAVTLAATGAFVTASFYIVPLDFFESIVLSATFFAVARAINRGEVRTATVFGFSGWVASIGVGRGQLESMAAAVIASTTVLFVWYQYGTRFENYR
jgi:hypothetical protein